MLNGYWSGVRRYRMNCPSRRLEKWKKDVCRNRDTKKIGRIAQTEYRIDVWEGID